MVITIINFQLIPCRKKRPKPIRYLNNLIELSSAFLNQIKMKKILILVKNPIIKLNLNYFLHNLKKHTNNLLPVYRKMIFFIAKIIKFKNNFILTTKIKAITL